MISRAKNVSINVILAVENTTPSSKRRVQVGAQGLALRGWDSAPFWSWGVKDQPATLGSAHAQRRKKA